MLFIGQALLSHVVRFLGIITQVTMCSIQFTPESVLALFIVLGQVSFSLSSVRPSVPQFLNARADTYPMELFCSVTPAGSSPQEEGTNKSNPAILAAASP